jgi:hypothetical protein
MQNGVPGSRSRTWILVTTRPHLLREHLGDHRAVLENVDRSRDLRLRDFDHPQEDYSLANPPARS